ncbi:MAG: hypothetical protein A2231_10750 [Candidatus Firestonebacteria bacterium RIFOXYA2_FULL_40_8]|nr:MAG: hypothetical protein A2231_10750 [Candidatus Firestonebacteria bacterium RIFOXYA2_FULL_40_8]
MFCKFVKKNLSAYFDKETGRVASYLISKHLASCSSCKGKLELLSLLSKAVKQKEDINLSADFVQALKAKISLEKAKQQTTQAPVFRGIPVALKISLSAICLLIAFVGMIMIMPKQHEKEINTYATVAFQTRAEVVDTGSGLEYATFTNQTRR